MRGLIEKVRFNTENKFIVRCCIKKTIKKKPDSAIKTFLEIDVIIT